jgi:hypothetical protein
LQAAFVVGSPANEGPVSAIESPMMRSIEIRVFIDTLHEIIEIVVAS